MGIQDIAYGGVATSSVLNDNFHYLDDTLTTTNSTVAGNTSSISTISTTVSTISSTVTSLQSTVNSIAGEVVPIGSIIWVAYDTAPTGYLICNGAAISRNDYADLFAKINTAFGTGDGSTTFNIPDLIGKVAYGSDTLNSNSFKTDVEDTNHGHAILNAMGGTTTKHTDIQNASHKHTVPAVGLLPCIKY